MKTKVFKKLSSLVLSSTLTLSMCMSGISASAYDSVTTNNSDNANGALQMHTKATTAVTATATDSSKFTYNVLDDGTAEITKFTGDDETVVIPSTIDGYKVTRIGSYAFNSYYNTNGRKTIIVPEGVTSIGRCAFSNSPYIQKIQLPESLKTIDTEAFYSCNALSDINFPDSLTFIGDLAFGYCESITAVTLDGGNITEIDNSAFFECDGIESVTINGSNTVIDSYAFKNCTSLNSLTLNGIKTIGQDSFAGCNLTVLVLPDGVESLTYSSFALNPNLNSVVIPASVNKIDTSSFYACDKNLTFYGYAGSYAETFANNFPMLGIKFVALDGFTYNVLADGTAEITKYTGDAETVVIPSIIDGYKVTKIGSYAFNSYYNTTGRKTIIVPEGVTSIGRCAFGNSPYIQKIQLPESLEVIEREAFYSCKALSDINFPDKLTFIGDLAFGYCESLTAVTLDSGNITEIDTSAFFNCYGLETVTINGNNAVIDNYAFYGCNSLNSLTLEGIKTIGQDSFTYCNLTELVLPDGVESLTYSSFALNPNLNSVVMPASVTKMEGSTFYGCAENLVIYGYTGSYADTFINGIPQHGITFVAIDKFTYKVLNDGTAEITKYTGDAETVVIPSTIDGYKVTRIGDYAFSSYYGTGRKTIIVPEGVTSIGRSSFSYSYATQKIQLPESLETIGREAFYDCKNLATINFPKKIKSIGTLTFAYCDSLKSVTLEGDLELINESGFYNCESLESVTINANNAVITDYAFASCWKVTSLSLNGIKSIGGSAFSGCAIEEVVLPDGLESIGMTAFGYGDYLKKAVIPKSVTFIDSTCFSNRKNLVIYSYVNSTAETYSTKYNLTFVALDDASITGDINLKLTNKNGICTGTTTLEAGTYSFKIDVDGTQYGAGHKITNKADNFVYSTGWKASTTFVATGGEYTFSYNPTKKTLSIAHKKTGADTVALIGDISKSLTKSANDKNIFSGEIDLPAGTYSFKLSVDGTEFGGKYTFTDKINNVVYNPSWKGNTTFTATGGKYTVTFNTKTNLLTITPAKTISSVAIVGNLEFDLTPTTNNQNVFTATVDIAEGAYNLKVSVDGTEYGSGANYTDKFANVYSPSWKSFTTFNATGGTYKFTFNTTTNKLTVIPV